MTRSCDARMARALALRHRMLIGALGVLLAAGCGGSESDASKGSGSTNSPVPQATAGQYASIVAEHTRDLSESIAGSIECLDSVLRERCTLAGVFSLDSVAKDAAALWLDLKKATNADMASVFIGRPPHEIADLVARTIADAQALTDAAKATSDQACSAQVLGNTPGHDCPSLIRQLADTVEAFEATVAAWQPYL